ncbi:MAG TPA: metallophosphoesterase family protein [Polyangia bacterium]
MALIGIISDVHGNLEALRAVLALLERRDASRVVCLGDLVGYNADSDECIRLVRERGIEGIAGNHDLISIGRLGVERCADKAAFALRRTRTVLTEPSAAYLAGLPLHRRYPEGFVLTHGSVDDPQRYLRTPAAIRANAAALGRTFPGVRVCFFGHTHEPRLYEIDRDTVRERRSDGGPVRLTPGLVAMINPGSVDASRKRVHKLAECATYDAEAALVTFHRVPYDHRTTEDKARRGGFRIDALSEWLSSARRRVDFVRRRLGPG